MFNWQDHFELTPQNPPNDGILFVNHEPQGRGGHLGHALVEYAPGKILAFYANCSAVDRQWKGHSADGWMEYKRSTDAGRTWSKPIIEPNSKALYDSGCGRSMFCEKAVCTDEGTIVLFYLTCDLVTCGHIWEPYFAPCYAISRDGGETWSKLYTFVNERGRIWDAVYHNGVIYVLYSAGEWSSTENPGNHEYRLYVSSDNGQTWQLQSTLPLMGTKGCFYGTMAFADDRKLICYVYEDQDEYNLKLLTSTDCGKTWSKLRRSYFDKMIRNPQIINFNGTWFLHGRSGHVYPVEGCGNFVLYASDDGIHWDNGHYLYMKTAGHGAYSNNLIVHDPDGADRLLIQCSRAYYENRTNILTYWLDYKNTK